MYKAAAKSGKIYEFSSLDPPDLKKWIKKRIRTHKKQIGERELQQMIDQSGYYDRDSDYSLYHFENDISKVILHSEGDAITREDILISMSGNTDTNVFTLIDHLGRGNKKAAFDMLSDMFLYGENEYRILALLSSQFEKILGTKQLMAEGRGRKEIARILGARDFQVERFIAAGRKYSEAALKEILEKIYSSDKKIKSGDMDSRIALELLIGEL
jgi:DNA polymerase-3 subunit delta